MFAVALYDVDAFRRLALDPPFLRAHAITPETALLLKTDDQALLRLAYPYLKLLLGLTQSLILPPELGGPPALATGEEND